MISNDISLIQHNAPKSAELASAIAEFLAQGGVIEELPIKIHRPESEQKPYGRDHDEHKQKAARIEPPEKKPRAQASILAEAKKRSRKELEKKVSDLAEKMTLADVSRQTGISKYNLRRMASSCGFQFQQYDPTPHLKPNSIDRADDAMNVLRIKYARDRGLSRKDASDELRISYALMTRLITEYAIDYPKQKPGPK
ncbi:hypothetical protein IFR09_11155 [Pseudomonas syringae]|nr:hypothetical protein [Pseudomonas syringae]MBD8801928.1 hypothetical protein [Pseudomonas syringae]MBD8811722.1 hypothetical protein [Pseudomonas syringae]